MLYTGQGGPKNEAEARRLLGLAAAQGDAYAFALLARMHNAAHDRPKVEAEAQRPPHVTKARKGASVNATAQVEDAAALAAAAARADAAMAALLAEEESEAEKARSKKGKAKAKKKAGAPTEASANASVGHASVVEVKAAAVAGTTTKAKAQAGAMAVPVAEAGAKARTAARAEAEAKAAQAEAEEQARNQAEQEAKAAANAHTATEAAAGEETPDHFICPITQDLMIDPASAADGHTYERRAIEEWLVSHSTSPMTGAELKTKDLFPNHIVRGLIRTWQEAQRCRPDDPAARP